MFKQEFMQEGIGQIKYKFDIKVQRFMVSLKKYFLDNCIVKNSDKKLPILTLIVPKSEYRPSSGNSHLVYIFLSKCLFVILIFFPTKNGMCIKWGKLVSWGVPFL